MAGATITAEVDGLALLEARLAALARPDFEGLGESVGALVASQTQRRMHEEKTDPAGAAWAPWSPKYAKTRHAGQSLLESEGHLRDAIQHLVHGDEVEVGSNLKYARAMQYGLDIGIVSTHANVHIPARPYLGLSGENEGEILSVLTDFLDRTARGAA